MENIKEEKAREYAENIYLPEQRNTFDFRMCKKDFEAGFEAGKQERDISTPIALEYLRAKLEVNAGRLAESLIKQGKNPREDENCHKAFLVLANLEAIEEYLENLSK